MNKSFILLLLLLASIRGMIYSYLFKAQNFIQLGENLQIQSLSELHQMDVEKLDCSLNLLQISQSMKAWQEILENEKELDEDIKSLLSIQAQVREFRKLTDHRQVFVQIKSSVESNVREIGKFDLSPYQSWRQEGIDGLQGQLNLLDQAKNFDESQVCCDKIEKLINQLLSERENIKKQCQQPQITINIINSKANQLSKTQQVCEGQGVIIKGLSDKDKVVHVPDIIPEQSETVSDSEDEEDVDTDAKKKISDTDREEPIQVREQQSTDPYAEYGYGFWARFLIQFPTRLPNGKDQPWYFISRLTSNKNYDNTQANDRLLAIWLGKGYYHFTTSDIEKQQTNIVQNINYPDDIDGLWTYIYYSYSLQLKKAVAFIKYGEEPIKSAVHNVAHPKINYLKFVLGGKDNGRYPAFNGILQNIYVAFQQGVFKDTPEEILGVLQGQKVIPKPGITSLIGYKLITTPVQRDPKAEPIQQVIGGSSVKFPQEYSFSGWFKWIPPKQQEDWHNVFRVQISQPSTDKFLGDRTLSLWVGKQENGILHFPTYTYTNMEGQGNPNLFKNIPHKDRINNEWSFVYFGYSRPLRQARVYVQFKDTEEELSYDKVNHFTVPKFYVYVGKDKHFPGFSGQIALTVFNLGEGAFKQGNDFKAAGDPFQFKYGDKKLRGEYTQDKINKPTKPEVDDGIVKPSSTDEEKPTIDQKVDKEEPFTEYGYGFWARFLTLYPTVLLEGKKEPWYFVSRLTYNENYKNIEMGDRTLAIWQGQGKYAFCTIDQPRNQANYVSEQLTPQDIEGLWTYFYYSYSVVEKKAIGFTKFGEEEPKVLVQQVTHPSIKFLRFILGGKDAGRYPGFNGIFTQVFFSSKEGAFIDKPEDLNNFIKQSIIPKSDLNQLFSHEIVDDELLRKPDDAPEYEEIGGGSQKFPHEYGISGWFKWSNPAQQKEWHNVFRVQVFKPSTDRYLGDRTLSLWVGTQQGGILHFPTYSYTSNNGAGNPNLVKNIQHKNRHLEWFFVYFGYSKNERKAFVSVRFTTGIETIEYPSVNHYYAPIFYIYAGKDQQFPGFSGKLAYVKFTLGNGAFRSKPDFKEANDSFGYSKGEAALIKVIKPSDKVKPQETVDKDTGVKIQPSGINDSKPKVNIEEKKDADLTEYGYGFYARFLTAYPTRLLSGKDAAWYFVSRLTKNTPNGNAGMGDRVLAIWQGAGFYHFTTNNAATGNVNQIKNINYPEDIEGLWTYFYYSYSVSEKKAVALVKYGTQTPIQADHITTHAPTKYLRFILGGKDDGRYPGFNGQFSQVYFSTQPGVFIGSADKFNEFVGKVPTPIQKTPLVALRLVDGIVNRKSGDQGAEQELDTNLIGEYAISGWFNWEPAQQQPWHNIFRVTLKKPSTDAYLGDRTLAAWLGQGQGGIIHLTTYTYTTMNGAGTSNTPQNILHKNRHLDWFFVYFGYSKQQKLAYAFIKWNNGEDSLEFKNTNHYLAQKLYSYVGKDAHFSGWSGRIAHVAFVIGDQAFKKGPDYSHPQDVFRFEKGTAQLIPKVDPSKPSVIDKNAELPSSYNNNAPVIDKVVQSPDNLNEYGYGFWMRFLTAYPQRLISGKNAPWYFVVRLTVNINYDNTRMGDRTLAIWQGLGFYHITTCNTKNGSTNVIQNINFAEDIEGLWTYVYYSYSFTAKKAVAFIKYGKEDPKSITHQDIHHPVTRQFRFLLGGMDDNRYPAFNGIFTQVQYGSDKGTFIETLDRFNQQSNSFPTYDFEQLNTNIIDKSVSRGVNEQPTTKIVGDEKVKLPSEYGISGWFQWQPIQPQQPWHNLFRVQILSPSTDRYLGDRTLSLWLGAGILHFPTYTYTNLIGAGNPNLHQNINHKDRHLEWFFVYFGYSKDTKNAYVLVKWTQQEDNLNYPNVNHYFAPKFYIYAGKDPHFPGFNGKIAYVNFNVGPGSFKKGSDYNHPKDIFGFQVGQKELFKPVEPQKKPEPDTRVLESKHNENAPLVDKTSPESQSNLEEYGYGYWFRYLTTYPARLVNGKNQPWYFISRLTTNLQYENIRMGDRALAVWQGQGFYLYVTCNTQNNEANLLGKINYPDDIEGVWTYLYYSYSVKAKSSIGFIKYGNQEFLTVKLDALNPAAKQVRFVVGGNDDKRYPGLNGIITSVYFNTQIGAFISTLEDIKKFLPTQGGEPSQGFKDFISKPVVGDTEVTRETAEPALKATVTENKLPVEYAISGWFRFKQNTQLQPWHTGFRVESKQPSTDNQVGDRVLYFQIGKDGGIAWFATYTYTNMNGGGQVSVPKSTPHNNRHFEWFFVYQGYSKAKNQAQAYIKWTKDDNSLEFPNVRHYLTPEFFISIGNDPYFAGWSGKIALVQFHIGEGSFKTGKDFADPKDAFKIDAATQTILKPKKEEEKPIDIKIDPIKADIIPDAPKPISGEIPDQVKKPEEKKEEIFENKSSQDQPIFQKTTNSPTDLVEYGYGYWFRFLTTYPERLPNGLSGPWYFLSRLTSNQNNGNVGMGDRILSFWISAGKYEFATCNTVDGNPDQVGKIVHPDDIEGVWTFMYYSYSVELKSTVGFIKLPNQDFQRVEQKVTHPKTKFLRLTIGGNDQKRSAGFNGLFTKINYNYQPEAFISKLEDLEKLQIFQGGPPSIISKELVTKDLVEGVINKEAKDERKAIQINDARFPQEYAISGWFKFIQPTVPTEWNSGFRVQINTPGTDTLIGDRLFIYEIGKVGGIIWSTTYSYKNMKGEGSPGQHKSVPHKDRHFKWHFVYQGYSKPKQFAQFIAKFTDSDEIFQWPDTNHYYTNIFHIFLGTTQFQPGWSGQQALISFHTGEGSFKADKDFLDPKDTFKQVAATNTILKPPEKKEAPAADNQIFQTKFSQDKPIFDKTTEGVHPLLEYGYGFWFRFLTIFPERMPTGLSAPWYFISRLTTNQKYENLGMGDRALSFWQSAGKYEFATCNIVNGNPDFVAKITHPDDIEGVWTYIYYSYSVELKTTVGFLKFPGLDFQQITQQVTHPSSKIIRLVIGGNDVNRSPGLNGQITRILFNDQVGAYIPKVEEILKLLSSQGPEPSVISKDLLTKDLVEGAVSKDPKEEKKALQINDARFPQEYAISGWFKFIQPSTQTDWNSGFRVQINTPGTDNLIGDRVLMYEIGKAGGILWSTTYTYKNMKGEGLTGQPKSVPHKDRHLKWHFVYQGYSKPKQFSYFITKFTESEESFQWSETNHYYSNIFHIFLGTTQFQPGWSGQNSYVTFNTGEGAFRVGKDFAHQQDVFKQQAALNTILKPAEKKAPPSADVTILEHKSTQDNPLLDKTTEGKEELAEYGYGFWFRFLTVYPERLQNGKNAPWYFVSRLTTNEKYDNIRMGDRALAVWQGQGNYILVTCNAINGDPNVFNPVDYPSDIEGVWTYVYYSYSVEARNAMGFMKFVGKEFQVIDQKVAHPNAKTVRLIVGGNDQKRYPGFNGLVTRIIFNDQVGAFITKVEDIQKLITQQGPEPSFIVKDLITKTLVDDEIFRETKTEINLITVTEKSLPHEYAISGWFRFSIPANKGTWNTAYRVGARVPPQNNALTDRTLCYSIDQDNNVLQIITYSYSDMNGNGQITIPKTAPHKDRHLKWHFIYQGYSKVKTAAYFYAKFSDSEEQFEWEKINHYFVAIFYITIGSDPFWDGWNGKIAYMNFNTGEGSYRTGKDFTHPKDLFGFDLGLKVLINKAPAKPADKPVDTNFYDSDSTAKKPLIDKEATNDKPFDSYGYGYWFRFMTVFPARLISGKNAPWYFMSRITNQNPYDNIRMGDRVLAVWQGDGYYHFTTNNIQNGNVNQIINNNYPTDIEGLWTFLYYSYSFDDNEAVGFIKYGNKDVETITHKTVHARTKYIRFILGGNDNERYPGFNGQFTQITFATKDAFIKNAAELNEFLKATTAPATGNKTPYNFNLVPNPIIRNPEDDPKFDTIGGGEKRFPFEYAISGWYRWRQVAQQAWHNLFRVSIKNPSTDQFLGDRTLTCWLGLSEGGILHMPTYTYANMVGGGNTNLIQNIQHKDRHREWFFIYFGYSKTESQAFAYVKWTNGENSNTYDKVNHYFSPEFFVYVGKDKHFIGHSGNIAYVNFNLGDGSFKKGDYTNDKDSFGLKAGLDSLFKPVPHNPGEAEKGELSNAFDSKKPVIDKEVKSENFLEEYGYGFWLRFLTVYPKRLIAGKNEAWYFVSRLTSMNPYDNIRMNDRRLAIWQGAGYYHFTTSNSVTGNVNQIININFPEDIEGIWTYIYYSYSDQKAKSVGLIKYGTGDIQVASHDTSQEKTKYVRFILGGNDNDRYPGFNGIFTSVTFGTQLGTFIGEPKQLAEYLTTLGTPDSEIKTLTNTKLVDGQVSRATDDPEIFKAIGQEGQRFPHEYAISGWFRWQPTAQQAWHNFFRVQIKQPTTDTFLGDRTLTMWLGLGFLHFPTYTYVNMVGGGNTNYHQNINHKDRHLNWFFVYYGYSKKVQSAYIYVKWTDSEDQLNYEKINHYFAPEFFVYVGKDKFYPGLNGKIGYVSFNTGQGSFTKNLDHKDDVFGLKAGLTSLAPKKTEFEPTSLAKTLLPNAFNQDKPVIDQEAKSDQPFEEYGYGFWLRFLTVYPQRLVAGKNEAWYFVSRLTSNNPYDNIRMNDRTLAVWQGQGYYHFTACNSVDNNPNYIQNINFPEDIEGLWTYIYYSYSADQNQAVAFIKYGDAETQTAVHKLTQAKVKYLRFILGGNDAKRYPGFNGVYTSVVFTTTGGAFVESKAIFDKFIEKNQAPSISFKLDTQIIIEEVQKRAAADDHILKTFTNVENPTFPREYAMSGWYKWATMVQTPWHNLFRVQIKSPPTDALLGDRTLCLWLGAGYLHFPTYTYTNMNGAGNNNWWQNIDHKERHTQWFFVYFGYSKIRSKAYAYVKWTSEENNLSFDKAKHYFSHQFFIYIGKDTFLNPGFNGQQAQIRWNSGEGAFRDGNDFKDDKDTFGFSSFKVPTVPKFNSDDRIKDIQPLQADNKKGTFTKEWDDLNGVKEYGFGFWIRYLARFPIAMKLGNRAPWSIIARLSKNADYGDARIGDRTLAVWLGDGFYHFTTYDGVNPNFNQNINHPADIEGLWTFIHFSHNIEKKKSVAFIKFGGDPVQRKDFPATHVAPVILRYYLGRNDGTYPSYNGQITEAYVTAGEGIFVENEDGLNGWLKIVKKPDDFNVDLKNKEIIPKIETFRAEIEPKEQVIEDAIFTTEYAWSGWFKWSQPEVQKDWHLMVRLSNLQASENLQFLGDRDLSAWVGKNILHFSTYTYTDQKANGNADIWKQIPYLNDLPKWHFVYFGYSRTQKYAWASVEFLTRTPTLEWKDVNHYLPNKFSLYVAKDKWHNTYSGNIGYLKFNAGQGSFAKDGFDKNEKDIFGYSLGKKELIKPAPKVDFNDRETKLFNSPQDGKDRLLSKEWSETELETVIQYGYGYWFRYLTQFPFVSKTGRQNDWAFMSRLTNKKIPGDLGLYDGTLATWSAKGFYRLSTFNIGTDNLDKNMNYPDDIEGVWSFIYFSHHLDKGLSVGMIKIGSGKIAKQIINAKHTIPNYLKFYIGGNSPNHPSFNGQYSDIIVSAAEGSFLENEIDVEKLLELVKKPEDFNTKSQTLEVIPKSQSFLSEIQPKEIALDTQPLVNEYAWSGWFKWTPTVQQPWHLGVRLTIHTLSENMQFLGDRTLNMWVGNAEGGILHFATYTYDNMYGGGNANVWQNIKYEADLARWHFVYFGYSFVQKLALAKVEFAYNRVETKEYKVRHYLPNKFFMNVAKDKWHSTYSGIIGYLRFNTGAGAFSDKPFEAQASGDIFGYVDGKKALVPEIKEPPLDPLAKQEMILSSFNGKIQLEKEFKQDVLGEDLQEYGYGFYIRFLTQYPTQMLNGKPESYYILSRLTKNEKYADVGMGDRLLAIWQGQGIYVAVTNNLNPVNDNFNQVVPYGDIEAVWTFMYFSYSLTLQKATFLVKYDGNDEVFRRDYKCNHGAITYLKFILGGASGPYQGFNGQIANTAIKFGAGAYIDDFSKWSRHLHNRIPRPPADDNSFKSVDVLNSATEAPYKADKSSPPYQVLTIETESMFQQEYSVTGWIRWEAPPVSPWYNVWRLTIYKEEDNLNAARLGDRDHSLFKHTDYYHFTSYTYKNLNNEGETNLWHNIPHAQSHLQWHFIFSGYNRKLRQIQHHITFIDDQKEIIIPNINHYVLYRHYFHFGKDFKKWEGIHNGFQGFATKIQLNYGEGSYQLKPFNKPESFFFAAGKKKSVGTQGLTDPVPSIYKSDKPSFDIQLEGKDNIRGLQEYGWTLWVRWMRTGPENLLWMDQIHTVARLTFIKNYQDYVEFGDRVLHCLVYSTNLLYGFRTQHAGVEPNVHINTDKKMQEGSWNLLSWTYKKNIAKYVVLFNGKEQESKEINVVHSPVGDYLRFVARKEFTYSVFHGFYAKISLRLGDGAFVDEKQFQLLVTGELSLPDALIPKQTRKTIPIQKDLIQVKHEQVIPDIIIPKEDVDGKEEYAISGWAKFVDPPLSIWNLLIRVSTNSADKLDNLAAPGDRTFGIWRGEGYYHFCTYTTDQGNGGQWALCQNSDYQGSLHKNWVFFYFGYSRSLQKAFAYIKYPTKEDKLVWTVLHQVPYRFLIQLKKDKWHQGFSGSLENWYLNLGTGSYKESGFDTGGQGDQTFGFSGRVKPVLKQWQSLEQFDVKFNEKKVGVEVEYKDDSINGLEEYGYGFWSRFLWNGPTKLDKPSWQGLARLTINQNYEGDDRQVGDRQLAIFIGCPFYQFTTSQPGHVNIWTNVNYNQMLDGQWNFIYFGYKKTPKGGVVIGHVLFEGISIRSTEFSLKVITHVPVQDYLYFSVGSSGSKLLNQYYQFNGQISSVRLVLGDGGLIETGDDLKKFAGRKPDFPKLQSVRKTIFEEQEDMKREKDQVAPKEFATDFEGADEYTVSIWFKWSSIGRVAWEAIYTLTYNEPAIRGNHVRPGDRVLSMFQYADHRIFFSSYSTPDNHDAFAQVYTECPVPAQDQTSWVYGYYTYSKKFASLVSYLKTRSTDCEKKIAAMHRLPKYFGLYLGKDGIHTPYNGKFAHVYLWSGEGSYREKDYIQFQPYLAGATGIQSKPYKYSDKSTQFDLTFDQEINIDFESEKVNGHQAYGYGFWIKYLTAYPKRLLIKPSWLELVRFTIVKDNKDNTNLGDRALAIWIGSGYYHFTTYNQVNGIPSMNQNIDYNDQLEGQWNFLYFSYSTSRSQATGFVKFGSTEEVKRVVFTPITHRPVDDIARIHFGKEFSYQGFNGQISGFQMIFGGAGYVHDTDSLEAAIKSQFAIPQDKILVATKYLFYDGERVKSQNESPSQIEWPDEFKFALEYSMFGWFRYDAKELATPNNIIMRLTNNEASYRKEFGQVGDRTLIAMLQAREYAFATYTLGKIDTDSIANIRKAIPYGNNYGLWTYIWVGYSWPKRQVSVVIKFQTEIKTEIFTDVLHMVPKYFSFFPGSDGMLGGWVGPMAKVGVIFGKGAFIDSTKGNFESMLPDVSGVNPNPIFEFKPDKEGIQQVPRGKDPGYDIVLKDQVKSISEYGYGLWTRWLMTTPQRVMDKAPFNHLIRLTNTEKYEDNVELGNRVLAIWVGKGYYHFTTYNKASNKVSIAQNIDYNEYLEGNWNYIYFSFTTKDNRPRAVGFVLFGDLQGEQIQRVEFVDLQHNPINGYARITVANNEFSYPAFNGMIADVRVFFGKGFVGSKEQFQKEILSQYPKPNLQLPQRKDILILQAQRDFVKDDTKPPVQGSYDQYAGVLEYAVSGWLMSKRSGSVDQLQTIFRFTINPPEIMKDKQNAGDRTLAGFSTRTKYILSTYDYGNLDTNDDDQNDLSKEFNIGSNGADWTFIYFGYSLKQKKAFGYTLYYTREDSAQFNDLKHFVINKFWVYIAGCDKITPGFEGTLYNWNVHLGEGSFTNKPKQFIEVWPYEPKDLDSSRVLSALLGNQGLSSVKIIKTGPVSGQIDPAKGPVSGQVESSKGPISGQVEKGPGSQSGELSSGQKPLSGQTTK